MYTINVVVLAGRLRCEVSVPGRHCEEEEESIAVERTGVFITRQVFRGVSCVILL